MLHFALRLAASTGTAPRRPLPALQFGPWLAAAAMSVLGSWAEMGGDGLAPWSSLAPAKLLEAMAPILAGCAIAWVLARGAVRLPRIPEGDIAALVEPVAGRSGASVLAFAAGAERAFTLWPVAGTLMLVAAAGILAVIEMQ
jgi:hypothetical protein